MTSHDADQMIGKLAGQPTKSRQCRFNLWPLLKCKNAVCQQRFERHPQGMLVKTIDRLQHPGRLTKHDVAQENWFVPGVGLTE